MPSYPESIRIIDVSPRDGLQNIKQNVSTADKIELIHRLEQAGVKNIEVASFVSPKWVPQMADASDILSLLDLNSSTNYSVLTPNLKGVERALDSGVKEIAVFSAASESFTQKNTNCSIDESLHRIEELMRPAIAQNVRVRGYVSCVLGCPYDGDIATTKVASLSKALVDMGCYEISLGDTIGIGTPIKAKAMLDDVLKLVPANQISLHFHDTRGQALANLLACLEYGVATIDSSVAGLGGCPYAKGASGNVSTEDVVYMLDGMGIETGINLEKLAEAGQFITQQLGIANNSRVGNVLKN
ncbi:MAG TPA: hydroxymethylglutaryl-CoA lyase [Cycloclasticus sp.]|jgi:hydroxymethylglutaryl-CoA lyase|nr:hydroxymethylglutaryl-CoA lyase [Cycloclasticus sp.]HIL92862.1 hydroxymethylglutaryl-CoA lyase [Cycloclasticus sp.]